MKIKKISRILFVIIILLLFFTYSPIKSYGTGDLPSGFELNSILDNYKSAKTEEEKNKVIEDFLNKCGVNSEKGRDEIVKKYTGSLTGIYAQKLSDFLNGVSSYNGELINNGGSTGTGGSSTGTGGSSTGTGGASGIDIDTGDLKNIYGGQDATYKKIGGRIIGVVTYLCYAAAVIVLVYKGVQFMQKAPEAKAEAKKELVSYAVGAFILFGIGGILQIIGTIAKNSLF